MNDQRQMETAEAALAQLTNQRAHAPPPPKFAFTEIGEQIIASLMKAADDQVKEAEDLRVEVMRLADSIGRQLEEQARALAAMHERTKAFGLDVVEAHKKFINGDSHGKT
jgi:glycerate-2-kinase